MGKWKKIKLREVLTEVTERNKDEKVKDVLSVTNSQGFVKQEEYFEGTVHSQNISNYKIIRKNQFAYNPSRVNVGSIDILKTYNEGVLSPMYVVFEVDSTKLLPEYFKHYFQTHRCAVNVKNNTQGSVRNSLSFKALSDFDYFLPPLKEQEKIVNILKNIDDIIKYNNIKIDEINKYRKYIERQIFTYGIRKGTSYNSEIGKIPSEWSLKPLIELAEYVDYRGKTPKKVNRGKVLVTAKNIKKGFIDYSVSQEYINESDYEEVMARGKVKIGDVLITTEAPCGNIAQVDDDKIALAQRVIKYRGKENLIDNKYLKYYMLGDNFQKRLKILSTGGTAQGIKGSTLHKMLIAYPTINEQKYISNILDKFEIAVLLLSKKIFFYSDLKKYLMEQLLTGKIKVKIQI